MANLPKSVTIGGKRLRLKLVAGLDSFGEYDHDTAEIRLSATASQKDMVSTLRHELMHAALRISGVAFAETIDEESVVRCLDEIFFPAWEKILMKIRALQTVKL